MSEHPNAVLVRDLFRAFRESDMAAIERVVSDEAVWEFPGRRGDKVLDNPTCLRIRIENGQIVELREFVWDLFEVDEFWA